MTAKEKYYIPIRKRIDNPLNSFYKDSLMRHQATEVILKWIQL